MWIASTIGFYSVAEWEGKKWFRVRCKVDAENLMEATGLPADRFVETQQCDYPWRVRCDSQEEYDLCMKVISETVNYWKFKPEISKRPDQAPKHDGYMRLWAWLAERFGGGSYDWMHQQWKRNRNRRRFG